MTEETNELLDFTPVDVPSTQVEIVSVEEDDADSETSLVTDIVTAIAVNVAVAFGTIAAAAVVVEGAERFRTWRDERRQRKEAVQIDPEVVANPDE